MILNLKVSKFSTFYIFSYLWVLSGSLEIYHRKKVVKWRRYKKFCRLKNSVNLLYWIDLKATNEDSKDGEPSAINKSSEEASTRTVIQDFLPMPKPTMTSSFL